MKAELQKSLPSTSTLLLTASLVVFVLLAIWMPQHVWPVLRFVAYSLLVVSPIVIPGIILAAWITSSGASQNISSAFEGHVFRSVLLASVIGALTPVCGVTVLPLMAGLLGAGVPLAPVMAFWLSSPITDPAMLATTAATLGLSFAIGKTVAAFLLGLAGGLVTAGFARYAWYADPLRRNSWVGEVGAGQCGGSSGFFPAVWRMPDRRQTFIREIRSISRLIMICLIPAFAAEYALNASLEPDSLSPFLGPDNPWAVPAAVFVGAPAYLDGYAALPLVRGLMDHGLSQGAAMAFLISGGVVSIWGAMAIFPVLRILPFLLYLVLALAGSLAAGWLFGAIVSP